MLVDNLQENICALKKIIEKMETNQYNAGDLRQYLPMMNNIIVQILELSQNPDSSFMVNENYIYQVLKDVLYGMEHEDEVFLLDVLKYGLLVIFEYIDDELTVEQ